MIDRRAAEKLREAGERLGGATLLRVKRRLKYREVVGMLAEQGMALRKARGATLDLPPAVLVYPMIPEKGLTILRAIERGLNALRILPRAMALTTVFRFEKGATSGGRHVAIFAGIGAVPSRRVAVPEAWVGGEMVKRIGVRKKPPEAVARIALRPPERGDVRFLRVWKNDPVVRRWVGDGTRLYSKEDMERWFDRQESVIDRERRWIVEKEGRPVGFVGLYHIDPVRRSAEMGILLDPSVHGQGIGKEATRLLLDMAFRILNVHRVYLEVLADHQRARKLYRDCGFREEGRLRDHNFKEGHYVDVIVMGILGHEHIRMAREGGPCGRQPR